jgi:hypothetical protein
MHFLRALFRSQDPRRSGVFVFSFGDVSPRCVPKTRDKSEILGSDPQIGAKTAPIVSNVGEHAEPMQRSRSNVFQTGPYGAARTSDFPYRCELRRGVEVLATGT